MLTLGSEAQPQNRRLACHVRITDILAFTQHICLQKSRPVEIHQIQLRPADFFTTNPALDVPDMKNDASILAPESESCCENGSIQQDPPTHLQGTGPDLDPNRKP
jgi:hypothetical protein